MADDRAVTLACALIRRHEGLRLKPYLCPAGLWTVGYGHVIRDASGLPVDRAKALQQYGDGITQAQAEAMLAADVAGFTRELDALVRVPLTDPQRAALISFVFNIGLGAFRDSTLRRRLNRGEYLAVPVEMQRWVHAGKTVLAGLVARRGDEAALWRQPG